MADKHFVVCSTDTIHWNIKFHHDEVEVRVIESRTVLEHMASGDKLYQQVLVWSMVGLTTLIRLEEVTAEERFTDRKYLEDTIAQDVAKHMGW